MIKYIGACFMFDVDLTHYRVIYNEDTDDWIVKSEGKRIGNPLSYKHGHVNKTRAKQVLRTVAAMDKPCNLDALFTGSDPWVVTDKQTELAFLGLPF